jgi:hypothetical protein
MLIQDEVSAGRMAFGITATFLSVIAMTDKDRHNFSR